MNVRTYGNMWDPIGKLFYAPGLGAFPATQEVCKWNLDGHCLGKRCRRGIVISHNEGEHQCEDDQRESFMHLALSGI